MPSNRGFTLIELSIVLVIVGLIVGGVLVGRDLIATASVRSAISQVQKYGTAVGAFKIKYDCLPGDCAKAVDFQLGTPGGPGDNGDGNNRIATSMFMFTGGWGGWDKETFNFWYHLAKAGLIEGTYKGYDNFGTFADDFNGYAPVTKIRASAFINAFSIDAGIDGGSGDIVFGNTFTINGPFPTGDTGMGHALTALEAYYIDSKIDDGLPIEGNVQGMYPYSGPRIGGSAAYSGCATVTGGKTVYDVKGIYVSYANQIFNNPPNPAQIGCMLGIGNAF